MRSGSARPCDRRAAQGMEEVGPPCEAWKISLMGLPERQGEFQRWLFVRLAGVLFAGKAGELLVLGAGPCTLSIDQQIRCVTHLSPLWQYSHLLLCRSGRCALMIVYNPPKVQETLSEVPRSAFDQMGYPCAVGPKEFLEEVGRRWRRKGRIPHEIGLALGYPVKDVLGYIGLLPLECTARCGWKVYGNPAPSLQKRKRYREARERAEAFLGTSFKHPSVARAQ